MKIWIILSVVEDDITVMSAGHVSVEEAEKEAKRLFRAEHDATFGNDPDITYTPLAFTDGPGDKRVAENPEEEGCRWEIHPVG